MLAFSAKAGSSTKHCPVSPQLYPVGAQIIILKHVVDDASPNERGANQMIPVKPYLPRRNAEALRLVTRSLDRGLRFLEFGTRQTSLHGCPTTRSRCSTLSVLRYSGLSCPLRSSSG